MSHIVTGGVPIRYGAGERWKKIALEIGRTKPSRAPDSAAKKRKKNDGRPPDTSKELVESSKRKTKKKGVAFKSDLMLGDASYPWNENSCWLDSSLELLYRAIRLPGDEFIELAQSLGDSSGSAVFFLAEMFEARREREKDKSLSSEDLTGSLGKERDAMRKVLLDKRLIDNMTEFQSLFVSHSLYSNSDSRI